MKQMRGRYALLVGSSFSAIPLLFSLKKRGLKVAVVGSIPSDPCHQHADKSFFADYSKPGELAAVLQTQRFDYLVPSCNDYSYMACAALAEQENFRGFDTFTTAKALHSKESFRAVTRSLNIPSPQFYEVTESHLDALKGLSFPLLIKPVDSFSGRGMTKVENAAALSDAIRNALAHSRSKKVICEEFVNGSLHSHSAYLENGNIVVDFFVDEYCSVYPYQVDCSCHPSSLPEEVKNSVRIAISSLASACSLVDGLIHTQFIARDSQFWVIETMRRCPGDLYGGLLQRSAGIDCADLFVRPFIGMGYQNVGPVTNVKPFGRHTISVAQPLIYHSFSQNIPASSVEIISLKTSGETLNVAPLDKLAILFALFDNSESMRLVTPCFADYISIKEIGVKIATQPNHPAIH